MPRITLIIPVGKAAWTKTPNHLFDHLLPKLRDTELRILLILIRQTLGWHRAGKAVNLPYRLLKSRTGRGRTALTEALMSLKGRGLIHIERADLQVWAQNQGEEHPQTEQQE